MELSLYQGEAVIQMIYNISEGGEIFTNKKKMLKDNEHSIPIQLINQNIFNEVQEIIFYID